ncbi:conserved hypothetical protein [Candida dubliniensis CD36]|uniref:Uncharacterized protein n=1 Tax=Candida dubliniensis (strain CD36 / ATCC MYA-646 / CBS 7987 / NCPF 3949 / NRRL Y-17841) TaxID=573826 RepID=B9WFJ3_CANDC|nr:conserved hypothetical protein [Candida dubliniensis CD36]CAX42012.1 conserved hypothetical protein [Candida dubliniensis CD36]
MNELIENLVTTTSSSSSISQNTINVLHELGDLLRDDTNRIAIHDKLSILLPQFNKFLSISISTTSTNESLTDELKFETLRVVINILANNDLNRDFFTNSIQVPKLLEIDIKETINEDQESLIIMINEFWSIIKIHLDKNEKFQLIKFIFILLNQFIYDTNHKSQYLEFFNSLKIQWGLYPLINKDTIDDIGEFLYELLASKSLSLTDIDRIFLSGKILDNISIKDLEDEETGLIMIDLLSLNEPSNELYKTILQQISLCDTNVSGLIKRKLLVLASDLAPVYNDSNNNNNSSSSSTIDEQEKALNISIDQLQSTNDPYVFACCCITIGNFIHDKSSMEKALTILFNESNISEEGELLTIDKLISLYFEKNIITDVIQIQSIHMWNNLMNETIANKILTNILEDDLLKITKIIIDNEKYYQEILILYLKFIKKLIKLSNKSLVPFKVIEYILQNLDNNNNGTILDIKYLLLQKQQQQQEYGGKYTEEMFMELLKSLVNTINTTNVLEQLKTIAIINQQILNGELEIIISSNINMEQLLENYFHPLEHLLNQFISLLSESKSKLKLKSKSKSKSKSNNNIVNPNWEIKIFQNNLKFVAISIIKIIEKNSNELLSTKTNLLKICHDIINEKE